MNNQAEPSRVVGGPIERPLPTRLRVPTNRVLPGEGLNVGTDHVDVDIIFDPDLETLGEHQSLYGGDIIRLREWNEQVLLHELLHAALARSAWWRDPQRQVTDPNGHDVISRAEVALWETGWRLTRTPWQHLTDTPTETTDA